MNKILEKLSIYDPNPYELAVALLGNEPFRRGLKLIRPYSGISSAPVGLILPYRGLELFCRSAFREDGRPASDQWLSAAVVAAVFPFDRRKDPISPESFDRQKVEKMVEDLEYLGYYDYDPGDPYGIYMSPIGMAEVVFEEEGRYALDFAARHGFPRLSDREKNLASLLSSSLITSETWTSPSYLHSSFDNRTDIAEEYADLFDAMEIEPLSIREVFLCYRSDGKHYSAHPSALLPYPGGYGTIDFDKIRKTDFREPGCLPEPTLVPGSLKTLQMPILYYGRAYQMIADGTRDEFSSLTVFYFADPEQLWEVYAKYRPDLLKGLEPWGRHLWVANSSWCERNFSTKWSGVIELLSPVVKRVSLETWLKSSYLSRKGSTTSIVSEETLSEFLNGPVSEALPTWENLERKVLANLSRTRPKKRTSSKSEVPYSYNGSPSEFLECVFGRKKGSPDDWEVEILPSFQDDLWKTSLSAGIMSKTCAAVNRTLWQALCLHPSPGLDIESLSCSLYVLRRNYDNLSGLLSAYKAMYEDLDPLPSEEPEPSWGVLYSPKDSQSEEDDDEEEVEEDEQYCDDEEEYV